MPFAYVRYQDGCDEFANTDDIWKDKARKQPFVVEDLDVNYRYTIRSKYKSKDGEVMKLKGHVIRVADTLAELEKSLQDKRPRFPRMEPRDSDVLSTTTDDDDGIDAAPSVASHRAAAKNKSILKNKSTNEQMAQYLLQHKNLKINNASKHAQNQPSEGTSVISQSGKASTSKHAQDQRSEGMSVSSHSSKASTSKHAQDQRSERMSVISQSSKAITSSDESDENPSNKRAQSDSFDTGFGNSSMSLDSVLPNGQSELEDEVERLRRLLKEAERKRADAERQAAEQKRIVEELQTRADTPILTRLDGIERWMKTVDDRLSECNNTASVREWLNNLPDDVDVDFEMS